MPARPAAADETKPTGTAEHEAAAAPWVFGYGSLIWRVDFPILAARPARIRGWSRRFWQGSHDHRGTPAAPGRVATLVPEVGAVCVGMAYRVEPSVFVHLDYREKNGYERLALDAELAGPREATVPAITYVAPRDNAAYLGNAPLGEMAVQILRATGPSGGNADYLLELEAALRRLGAADDHVAALAKRVRQLAKR